MIVVPGEPKESEKPQPIGSLPFVVLLTTCTLCALFLLWRRADALRRVVSLRLKTLTGNEGRIRLSEDDGPPAREFLEDDDDNDDEPLSQHARTTTRAWREGSGESNHDGENTGTALRPPEGP